MADGLRVARENFSTCLDLLGEPGKARQADFLVGEHTCKAVLLGFGIEGLLLCKVIRINPFQFIIRNGCHADVVVDHVLRQLLTVDQNDLALDSGGVIPRLFREIGGGNE